MSKRILLERVLESNKQVLGDFYVLNDLDHILEHFRSLELPYLNNRRRVSCIPLGKYIAKKHISPKFGECLWLQDVECRSEILVHAGNFHTQILGCILIGLDFSDINNDGYLDVTSSRAAMRKLMALLDDQDEIEIEIIKSGN